MDTKELNKNLTRLNENIEKQVSLKFIIFKGIATGLATAVGASLVAGILFSFLSNTLGEVEDIPLVDDVQLKR